MIACDDARALLSERADGVIEPGAAARLDEHLLTCAVCGAYAERLTQVEAALRALPALAPVRDPWPAVRERLRGSNRRRRARRTVQVVGVVVLLVLAAALAWRLLRSRRLPAAPLTPPRTLDLSFLREPDTFVTIQRLEASLAADAEVTDLIENAALMLEEAAAGPSVPADVVRLVREADLRSRLRGSSRRQDLDAAVRQDLDRVCDMLDRIAAAAERRS